MSLNAPANQGDVYVVAMSMSTNYGVDAAPGVHVGLDIDFLFNLTIPTPDPTLFSGFQGTIDQAGGATASIAIPPLFIGCLPLHAQAAVITQSSTILLSNDLPITIQ
jgi:hypothetical protein